MLRDRITPESVPQHPPLEGRELAVYIAALIGARMYTADSSIRVVTGIPLADWVGAGPERCVTPPDAGRPTAGRRGRRRRTLVLGLGVLPVFLGLEVFIRFLDIRPLPPVRYVLYSGHPAKTRKMRRATPITIQMIGFNEVPPAARK